MEQFFLGKKVVVTGGAGFIAAHIIRRLISHGAIVHLLLRRESSRERINDLDDRIVIHEVDLLDKEKVASVLSEINPHGIFHLAAVNQSFHRIPTIEELVATNILATIQFMEITNNFNYDFFVNTSTFVEVGAKSHPIHEDDSYEPTEFYGISRIPAVLYGQMLARTKGKPIVTVRVFTPYGPYIQKGKLFYEIITKALKNETILLNDPSVTRDMIFIDDLVDLYLATAVNAQTQKGHVFNGGSGIGSTLEEIVKTVLKCTNSASQVEWKGQLASYDKAQWQADISKASKYLSWSPRHTLGDGVEKTVEWFREHQDYWLNK